MSGMPNPAGPLVVACLRISDPRPDVDPLTGEVSRDPRSALLSANDAAALERALQLAEAWQGQVLAVAAGGPAADDMLRDVAALGVRTLRVPWPAAAAHGDVQHVLGGAQDYLGDLVGDERALAAALGAAICSVGAPALVLCGDRSADRGTGALPAFLAHELGAAQALGLVSLEPEGSESYTLRAERRLDGGRRELLRVPSPAVCSVEAAGVRLRRAPLSAALAAGDVSIPVAAVHGSERERPRHDGGRPYRPRTRVVAPPAGAAPRDRLLDLTGALVVHDPPTLIGPIDASGAADALLEYLRRHGYWAGEVVAFPPPASRLERGADEPLPLAQARQSQWLP
jgi:electron transfer flavoprotein beta subunit